MSGGRVCALAATFAVAVGGAGCGGHGLVAWKGQPRSGPVEGGQMLFGTLVNRAGRVLRLSAEHVRVLDGRGRPLPAAAVFTGGYEAGIALRRPLITAWLRPRSGQWLRHGSLPASLPGGASDRLRGARASGDDH
jgi:hypothetical protein